MTTIVDIRRQNVKQFENSNGHKHTPQTAYQPTSFLQDATIH